jgi:hypothetical protein
VGNVYVRDLENYGTTTDNYISCADYEGKSWVGCVILIKPILMHLLPAVNS